MTRRTNFLFNLILGITVVCLGYTQVQGQQAPQVETAPTNGGDFGTPEIPSILKGETKIDPFGIEAPTTAPQIDSEPVTTARVAETVAPPTQAETQVQVTAEKQIATPRLQTTQTNPAYIPPQPTPISPADLEQIRRAMAEKQNIRMPMPQQVQPLVTQVQTDKLKITSISPQIQVTTGGPDTISINKESVYTVNVSNVSPSASGSLMIAIEIPPHVEITDADLSAGKPEIETNQTASRILWTIPNIPARSQENMNITLTPLQAIAFDLNVEWTFVPFTGGSRIQVTEPKVAMEITGPGEVKFGEKAIYTITLNNPGTGDAENVVVMLSDTLGGEQASVGRLAPGDRKQFEVELIARDAGQIDLGATVKADNDISVDSVKPITVRRARLEVAVTAPKFKYAGSDIGYRVTIANRGDAIADNVVAAIALPAGAEYLGGIQGAELTENGTAIRWNIGPMHAGKVHEYAFQCLLKQPGQARLEVGARGEEELAAAAVGETKVDALADLTLTVRDPRGPQQLNQEVLYEIHVENKGTKEATNVKIVGQFSPGIEPTRTGGLNSEIVPGSVAFETIPSIPVGKKVVVQVFAKADATGTHTFRAELNCLDQDIRRVSEGTTKYFVTPEAYQDDSPRTSNSADGGFSR